jgi:hypothetical protein
MMRLGSQFLAALLLCVPLRAYAGDPPTTSVADRQVFGCDAGSGWWRIVNPLAPTAGVPRGSSRRIVTSADQRKSGKGALRFTYRRERGAVPVLFNPAAELTRLKQLVFWARSRKAALLRIVTTDRDGARFFRQLRLAAGEWTEVVVRPRELQLSKDSPVRKAAPDSSRLGAGFGLFDLGGLLGETGSNDLWIDDVRVERQPIQRSTGKWVIESGRKLVVSADRRHDGPIVVKGRLEVRSSRFALHGDLSVDGGSVVFDGPVIRLAQRYRGELKFVGRNKASLTFSRAAIYSLFPVTMETESGAAFELHGLRMLLQGLHAEVRPGCRFVVDRVVNAGEFVLAPGGDLQVEGSNLVLVWFTFLPGQKTTLSLPEGKHLARWTLPTTQGTKLEVRDSREVMWGLLTTHKTQVTIKGSTLRAVGVVFVEPAPVQVKGLRNRTRYADEVIAVSDRTLRLIDTSVTTWNFYAMQNARLSVRDCLFGEAMVFNQARMEVRDSTCDGTGGFLGVLNAARIKLVGCTLTCDVNTYSTSQAVFEGCKIKGNVTAADSSRVKLEGTPVEGLKLTFGAGKVE